MKSMQCQEYRDLIAAHVDGTLDADEKPAAESHISGCAACARAFAWEQRATGALKAKLAVAQAPVAMKTGLAARLHKKRGFAAYINAWLLNPRTAGAVAVAAIAIFAIFFLNNRERNDFLRDAVTRYQTVIATRPGASLTGGFQAPAARRLDLTPFGYRLAANSITRVAGHERRESVFAGAEKDWVLAQEVDGVKSFPAGPGQVVRANNREFVKFSDAGVNLVAWKDNDLLCVLASGLPSDQLLDIAHKLAGRS